ncbi:cytochrome P450 [Nonomuraea zeae]|uniref:Cytochrome P450 n=1 Tax=Nonomuraea zeae TaxID=1642303 RepID=A0A5S4G8P7_9ACTN|nr:cytochrome P450 [Nonomuraea zeae]TMR29386.1 cytochrome P450 [Nonomuraea zeae]
MTEPLAALPVARPAGRPFDPPAELARLRAEQPLRRFVFPDGHAGWLALGHSQVRAVLSDPRFSSRYELQHYPLADVGPIPSAPIGDLTGLDAPEHTRYRKLLTGKFTVRRMNLLTERAEALTKEHLDAMEAAGPGADLVEAFARPVPAVMICELLGVPYDDRDRFQSLAATVAGGATAEEQYAAYTEITRYIGDLVVLKRAHPTDDLLSDLTSTELSDEELGGIGGFLLGAGLDTTTNMIALGTFALLEHPDQLALLRADPGLAGKAVEELMRFLTITHTGARAALEDVELDGQVIRAGETVALSMAAANRDPLRYPDPDVLDLRREAAGHLGFGHGIHQCLGQQLARVEMRAALPALATRFPTLRLAVAPEEVPTRDGMDIYGVHRLPVTW